MDNKENQNQQETNEITMQNSLNENVVESLQDNSEVFESDKKQDFISDNEIQSVETLETNESENLDVELEENANDLTCEQANNANNEAQIDCIKSKVSQNNFADTSTESIQNKNCKMDSKLDNKLKNLQFICIPFILTAIIISLFNMGKVRQPLSFLFLALGLLSLAITYVVRGKVIDKHCTCKECNQQSKSCIKYAIIFGVAALGLLGTFIYFMVV